MPLYLYSTYDPVMGSTSYQLLQQFALFCTYILKLCKQYFSSILLAKVQLYIFFLKGMRCKSHQQQMDLDLPLNFLLLCCQPATHSTLTPASYSQLGAPIYLPFTIFLLPKRYTTKPTVTLILVRTCKFLWKFQYSVLRPKFHISLSLLSCKMAECEKERTKERAGPSVHIVLIIMSMRKF